MKTTVNPKKPVFTYKHAGQNLTELGLVCGLVILTCVLAITQSGAQISGIFNKVDNGMKTALVNQSSNTESTGTMGTLAPDPESGEPGNNWSDLHGIPRDRDRLGGTGAGSGHYTSNTLDLSGRNRLEQETEVTGWAGILADPEEETTPPKP